MPVSQSDGGVLTQDNCPVRSKEGEEYCPTCQNSGPAAAVGGCSFYLQQLEKQRALEKQSATEEAQKWAAWSDDY